MIGETSVVERNDGPLAASIGTEVVMLDPDAGSYFAMGDTGSRIWELIDGPTPVRRICDALLAEFDVEPEACLRETLGFLRALAEAKLVRASG